MAKGWTRQEIANKIDWEGGLADTLRWGLSREHMPEGDSAMMVAFVQLERAFIEYDQSARLFLDLLPEPGEDLD